MIVMSLSPAEVNMKKTFSLWLAAWSILAVVGGFVLASPGPRVCGDYQNPYYLPNARCPLDECIPNPYVDVQESWRITGNNQYYVCADGPDTCDDNVNFPCPAVHFRSRNCDPQTILNDFPNVNYLSCVRAGGGGG
jgi:hypothetical protein